MTHLGDTASALVDGELAGLDDHARAHALAHLAGCATCRADVDAERRIRARLRAASAVQPPLPAGLSASLRAIAVTDGGVGTHAAGLAGLAGSGRPAVTPGPTSPSAAGVAPKATDRRPRGRDDSRGPGRHRRSRVRYAAVAGLAASVMVGLGGGSIVGAAGTAARAPSGPGPASSVETVSTTTVSGDSRPVVQPNNRISLSVVYRRP